MKRPICLVIALLALAVSAQAAPVRVALMSPRRTHPTTDADANRLAASKHLAHWAMILDALGVYWDSRSPEQVPTKQALSGVWNYGTAAGATLSQTYGVFVNTYFFKAADTGYNGCNRDSLTRYGVWSAFDRQTIQVFCGLPGVNVGNPPSTDPWAQSTTCSTGVQAFTLGFKSDPGYGKTTYVPGTSLRWRTGEGAGEYSQPVKLFASGQPGVLRTILGQRSNAGGGTGTDGQFRANACDDCDSLQAGEGAPADTAIMWARYRAANDSFPAIYLNPASYFAQGTGDYAIDAMVDAICMADSLFGHRVIGQKPGWSPIKAAIMLKGTFQRNNAGSGTVMTGDGSGIDHSDSTRYKAAVRDSLAKLGVKVTAFINPDSARAYPNEVGWYRGLSWMKFMPVSYSGQWSGTVEGNASPLHLNDPYGVARTRVRGAYGMAGCAGQTDTSTTCLLKYGFEQAEKIYPGRIARATYAPQNDYMGATYNQKLAGFGSVDGWNAALWWAGVRVVVIEPDDVNMSPNTSYATHSSGSTSATNAYLFTNATRRFPVYADSTRATAAVGSIYYAAAGLTTSDGGRINLDAGHPFATEFLEGLFLKLRYMSDQRFYYHAYRQHTPVFRIEAAALHGNSSDVWPRRGGWWQLKSVVNPTRAMNLLAGRTVVNWVYVDEL